MTPEEAEVIALAKAWRSQFWMPINEATKNFDYRIAEQLAAAVDRLSTMERVDVPIEAESTNGSDRDSRGYGLDKARETEATDAGQPTGA